MDEAVITIGGRKLWLWGAIDADGDVLDILVQGRRNTKAAKRFFFRLVRQFGQPRVVVTDKSLTATSHRSAASLQTPTMGRTRV